MPDLHRHDHFSLFDGFAKPKELTQKAIEKGYTALGIANHGTISGLAIHYKECRDAGIKPILGVEAYFQPKLNKTERKFHLCLFAKNLSGYQNLNRLMFVGEKQKYYKPIITFDDLEKYNEGIICTSACVNNLIGFLLLNGNKAKAIKAAKKFVEIYGDDFYIEIQPYKIDNDGTQEKLNEKMMELANELNIKTILASDSHFGNKEDFDTYQIMHKIKDLNKKEKDIDIIDTYGERYMPTIEELKNRFVAMHGDKRKANTMISNLSEIENKVEPDILDKLDLVLPDIHEGDSDEILKEKIINGLKKKGKYNKEYLKRVKEEYDVITTLGFSNYFLIVEDYVAWAKSQGIGVGPGRGSVCNCLVAYALDITKVDSIKFKLDFSRFLRKDKKKMPDIDLDFETARRDEVIKYILNRYKGKSAQIGSYGLYQVDNLLNDLAKVCGVEEKSTLDTMKATIKDIIGDNTYFDYESCKNDPKIKDWNKRYKNIIKHFSKLNKSIRYLGTHAAGVVVTGKPLLDYAGVRFIKSGNEVRKALVYDLLDAELVNIIKFDVLGLKTQEQIVELEKITGKELEEDWFEDEAILSEFAEGKTDGIFQFEKSAAKNILRSIKADCFEDVCAASAMNRPGPLSMKMPETYAENKFNANYKYKRDLYYDHTRETHGTVVYQEQLISICRNIGKLDWEDTDKVLKMMKTGSMKEAAKRMIEENFQEMNEKFIAGAISNGMDKKDADSLFEKLAVYTFNKGHSVGYTIISFQEMFYKVYYPTEYWFVKVKHAGNEADMAKYKQLASQQGILFFLPHVNYSCDTTLREVDGEKVIQEGLSVLKFVGTKAAKVIEDERKRNGPYKSKEDFVNRVPKRTVNSRVISVLEEQGALEFNKKIYEKRTIKYNSALYLKGVQNGENK